VLYFIFNFKFEFKREQDPRRRTGFEAEEHSVRRPFRDDKILLAGETMQPDWVAPALDDNSVARPADNGKQDRRRFRPEPFIAPPDQFLAGDAPAFQFGAAPGEARDGIAG